MKTFKYIAFGFVIGFLGYFAIDATIKHDAAQEAAYQKYDACVVAQYGMSAAAYYQEHGQTANCD